MLLMAKTKTPAIYRDVTNNCGTGFKDVVKEVEIYVGMPCTYGVGTDCYPAHVQRISDSGKTIWIQDASAVADKENGHDYFGNQVWIVTPNPDGAINKVTLRQDGSWRMTGRTSRVGFGYARYYQDPHF